MIGFKNYLSISSVCIPDRDWKINVLKKTCTFGEFFAQY